MEQKMEQKLSTETTDEQKTKLNFKDIKNFEDFDLNKIDMIKGETPKDIEERCLKLCRDYLSGDWNQQTIETIQVKRVSGGVTNQLYHCSVRKPDPSSATPQEVAIRLYGPKFFDPCDNDGSDRLSDVIIATMVSKNNLGPHLYGAFDSGQILKFYKHRQFKKPDHSNEKIVRTVFQYLARIHSMIVPIKKDTDWLIRVMNFAYNGAFERFPIAKEVEEYNCKTLMENNLREEMDWCSERMKEANSPIVFTHNDFRSSNIMITEPNDEVVICDFEYSAYGHRAYDLANMMKEWGREQWDFKSSGNLPPEDSVFGPQIQIYVEECERIYGKEWSQNPINSVEHILYETKVFLLVGLLFGVAASLKYDENDPNTLPMARKLCVEWAENSFKKYFQLKEKLIKQNVIQ